MNPGGPGLAGARFSVELSETGQVGIRDRRSGLLYLATGLDHAADDVRYLLERAARGDEDEVLRHLAYNDETARRRRAPAPVIDVVPPGGAGLDPSHAGALPLPRRDAPDPHAAAAHAPSPPLRDHTLTEAAHWTVAVEAVEARDAALAAAEPVRDLARRIEAAQAALTFAQIKLTDGAARLFTDPAAARGRLADSISQNGLEPTVARLQTDPALFGVLAPRPSSRFGHQSAARDVAGSAREVAAAIRESASAAVAVDALVAEVASSTQIPTSPAATPPGLAERLRAAADEILAGIPAAPSSAAVQQQTASLRASLARLPAADRDHVARTFPRTSHLLTELQRATTPPTLER